MIDELKKYSHFIHPVPPWWLTVELPILPRGYGYELKKGDYDWDNSQRGNQRFVLFQCTVSGMGHVEYDGRRYDVPPFSALLLPVPSSSRYWRSEDSEPWEFFYFTVTGDWVYDQCTKYVDENGPVIRLTEESPLSSKAIEYVTKLKSGIVSTPYDASALLYSFYATLFNSHRAGGDDVVQAPKAMRAALEYCRTHYRDQINLDDVAHHVKLSRFHLGREFKKHFQISPGEYILNLRLHWAGERLIQTNDLVKEIADKSGFQDYNYFCRIFRKRYGQSPGFFRKNGV